MSFQWVGVAVRAWRPPPCEKAGGAEDLEREGVHGGWGGEGKVFTLPSGWDCG